MSDEAKTGLRELLARLGGRRGWCSAMNRAGRSAGRKERGGTGCCASFLKTENRKCTNEVTQPKPDFTNMQGLLSRMKMTSGPAIQR